MKRRPKDRGVFMIALALVVLTLAAYWRVLGNGFIRFYDDGSYVLNNPHIQTGLNFSAIYWAFTTFYNANWHPLTWISHILDYSLFAPNPQGHHATSLILHAASSVLLFLILNRITGSRWRSAFVAALFAVHPLHVESVAWIAERKDVLSTFFLMLTLGAYVRYVERPGARRYAAVVLLFALGLMSKPMLVTLPFTLLLLDYWPLERFGDKTPVWKLIVEKTPLFALSAASCAITYIAQQTGGAVGTFKEFPLGVRAANAVVAYAVYVLKMLFPLRLGALYPHPGNSLPIWEVACAVVVLLGISLLVIRVAGKAPYLAVGWLWYVVTLIPVIGLVQVGEQAMADRYTYVPLIGLLVMISWGIPEIMRRLNVTGRRGDPDTPTLPHPHTLMILAVITIAVLSSLTWVQTGCWRDDATLFQHALNVTKNNATMEGNLGAVYAGQGDYASAAKHYSEAVRIRPDTADFRASLGTSLAMIGKLADAEKQFSEALNLNPKLETVRRDLESVRRKLHMAAGTNQADFETAVALFSEGVAFDSRGETTEAVRRYKGAIRLAPRYADPYCNLARAAYNGGDTDEAIRLCGKATALDPDLGQAHSSLAVFLYVKGDYADSWHEIHEAERCGAAPDPDLIRLLSSKLPDPAR